jgi:hypothetical protein
MRELARRAGENAASTARAASLCASGITVDNGLRFAF